MNEILYEKISQVDTNKNLVLVWYAQGYYPFITILKNDFFKINISILN